MHPFLIFSLILMSVLPAYGENTLTLADKNKSVEVGEQVQIAADLRNNQDFEQNFAYIVQIQDENGITVSLAWITGSLTPAQSFSPSLSWTPNESGEYTATIFVWESIDNPSALSPTLSMRIKVGNSI